MLKMHLNIRRCFLLITFIIFFLIITEKLNINKATLRESDSTSLSNKIHHTEVRDFYRYECKNRIRAGGKENLVKNAPHNLWRIDGAWFLCLDGNFNLNKFDECNVLSFGIHNDYSFDYHVNKKFKCNVHSFDPFTEDKLFSDIRDRSEYLKYSPKINVNPTWTYYRVGIDGDSSLQYKNVKMGEMLNFHETLKYVNLEENIIDILKMDIEGYEKPFLDKLNMNYACKYIKQFVLETHPPEGHAKDTIKYDEDFYKIMRKLEQCFLLYHRNTRFFIGDKIDTPTGHITEFQNEDEGYLLQLKHFKNEINLANFMFFYGELYFINQNFL